MVYSMTGYGYSSVDKNNYNIEVEIKSLNSKFFDLNIKSNYNINLFENKIRELIKKKLIRGKIELNISFKSVSNESLDLLDKKKYSYFFNKIKNVSEKFNDIDNQTIHNNIFNNLSFIIKNENIKIPKNSIINLVKEAINKCILFRFEEGKSIKIDLNNSLDKILIELQKIIVTDSSKKKNLKNRINNKIKLLDHPQLDKKRLEQEIFFYIEKQDINEEIVRLKKHLNLFFDFMKENKPIGKKLSFVSQEIGREINTIGSKCNDFKIQKSVVIMKEHLEKIKEENFNIL